MIYLSVISLVFSLLLIKVVGFFMKLIPAADFSSLDGFLSVTAHVSNVFAWAQQFLPVTLIITLFTLSLVAYSIKFIWKVAFLIVNFFK